MHSMLSHLLLPQLIIQPVQHVMNIAAYIISTQSRQTSIEKAALATNHAENSVQLYKHLIHTVQIVQYPMNSVSIVSTETDTADYVPPRTKTKYILIHFSCLEQVFHMTYNCARHHRK